MPSFAKPSSGTGNALELIYVQLTLAIGITVSALFRYLSANAETLIVITITYSVIPITKIMSSGQSEISKAQRQS